MALKWRVVNNVLNVVTELLDKCLPDDAEIISCSFDFLFPAYTVHLSRAEDFICVLDALDIRCFYWYKAGSAFFSFVNSGDLQIIYSSRDIPYREFADSGKEIRKAEEGGY